MIKKTERHGKWVFGERISAVDAPFADSGMIYRAVVKYEQNLFQKLFQRAKALK
jgi:hypothetical protein